MTSSRSAILARFIEGAKGGGGSGCLPQTICCCRCGTLRFCLWNRYQRMSLCMIHTMAAHAHTRVWLFPLLLLHFACCCCTMYDSMGLDAIHAERRCYATRGDGSDRCLPYVYYSSTYPHKIATMMTSTSNRIQLMNPHVNHSCMGIAPPYCVCVVSVYSRAGRHNKFPPMPIKMSGQCMMLINI
jgi:hypothetical protein